MSALIPNTNSLDKLCNCILIFVLNFFFLSAVSVAVPVLGLSVSASAVSLQQAFSEMRQGRFDPGPSTAPPMLHVSMPPLLPAATPLPSSTAPVVPLPVSSEATALPSVSLNPPGSSSPPPTIPISAVTSPPSHSQLPLSQSQVVPAIISVSSTPSSLPMPPVPAAAAITFPQTSISMPVPASTAAPLTHPAAPMGCGSGEQPSIPSTSAQLTPAAIQTSQLAPSTIPDTVTSISGALTPVHSQPQTSTVANQSHAQCVEGDSDPQGKGVDDIQALDKKLRSLFMDLGSGLPSAQSDVTSDPMAAPSVPGTSSPPACSTPSGTPLPPSSLPLNSSGQPTGSPMTSMGNGSTPVGYSQTTPSKAPLSRLPVSDRLINSHENNVTMQISSSLTSWYLFLTSHLTSFSQSSNYCIEKLDDFVVFLNPFSAWLLSFMTDKMHDIVILHEYYITQLTLFCNITTKLQSYFVYSFE